MESLDKHGQGRDNQSSIKEEKKIFQQKEIIEDQDGGHRPRNMFGIGAILGNGSEDEFKHLSRYGKYLGIILGLWNDFYVSINLTLELAEKIRCDALPYSLLWAINRSREVKKKIENLNKNRIEPSEIKEIVEYILETGILHNKLMNIKRCAGRAAEELLNVNNKSPATQTLKFFVEAQPPLFMENISALHINVDQ